MKKLIKYLLICNITIILFVILNILISYLWIFYNNFKYESKNFKEKMLIRYNELKNSIVVFNLKNKNLQMITKDISYILKNDNKKIHYVDNLHYSTYANTAIAKEILKIFNENKK